MDISGGFCGPSTAGEAELKNALDRAVRQIAVRFERVDGWQTRRLSDLAFYRDIRDAIKRIAIVGNERWRSEVLMSPAGRPPKRPVESFRKAR